MSKSAPKHFFSKLASVQTPRSWFDMSYVNTRTIKTDYLYPVMKQLVIPGDTWKYDVSSMIRLLSPIDVPMMDNLYGVYQAWFVPFRLVWDYTKNFFGEKRRPSDPESFSVPQVTFKASVTPNTTVSGYTPEQTPNAGLPVVHSLYDHFGLPIKGTDGLLTGDLSYSALPLRSYYLIWDEWYRDEQRQDYVLDSTDFGNEAVTADRFVLLKRGKRFDYFTSTLLEPQIGDPVDIPLGNTAPVVGNGNVLGITNGTLTGSMYPFSTAQAGIPFGGTGSVSGAGLAGVPIGTPTHTGTIFPVHAGFGVSTNPQLSGLVADLTSATPATIATLRQAFQLQAYNEINARSGSRYTEFIYGQYGVISPDARLQRPEFLGEVNFHLFTQPVVQNSATDANSPQGNLTAFVYGNANGHLFTKSFTEHGYIITLLNIYSDLTYYQGADKDWKIQTPLDIPLPVFGNLTDEPVYNYEIVTTGTSKDNDVFGYGERYAFYKYSRNTLCGLVRPNAPLSIGQWSLAQQFSSVPPNNDEFIESDTPIERIVAVTDEDQFIVNQKFDGYVVRALPQYSNPMHWMFGGVS